MAPKPIPHPPKPRRNASTCRLTHSFARIKCTPRRRPRVLAGALRTIWKHNLRNKRATAAPGRVSFRRPRFAGETATSLSSSAASRAPTSSRQRASPMRVRVCEHRAETLSNTCRVTRARRRTPPAGNATSRRHRPPLRAGGPPQKLSRGTVLKLLPVTSPTADADSFPA